MQLVQRRECFSLTKPRCLSSCRLVRSLRARRAARQAAPRARAAARHSCRARRARARPGPWITDRNSVTRPATVSSTKAPPTPLLSGGSPLLVATHRSKLFRFAETALARDEINHAQCTASATRMYGVCAPCVFSAFTISKMSSVIQLPRCSALSAY